VELYREQLEYPTTIVGFEMKVESASKTEFRVCADGKKIFPFSEANDVPGGPVTMMSVDIAAGCLLTVEVKGTSPADSFVVILSELDCVERR